MAVPSALATVHHLPVRSTQEDYRIDGLHSTAYHISSSSLGCMVRHRIHCRRCVVVDGRMTPLISLCLIPLHRVPCCIASLPSLCLPIYLSTYTHTHTLTFSTLLSPIPTPPHSLLPSLSLSTGPLCAVGEKVRGCVGFMRKVGY